MAPPARLLLISAACAVALAACGGGNVATSTSASTTSAPAQAGTSTGQAGTSTTAGATTVPAPTSTAPIATGTIPASEVSPAGKPGQPPTLRVPSGKPPTQLEEADLIQGNGPAAKAGDNVTMQYVLGTY